MQTLDALMKTLPQEGKVTWIGLRPARDASLQVVDSVSAEPATGLAGDRYTKADGKRQVTLIQAEHLAAVGSMLGLPPIDPADARRNIVVSGINLLALKDKQFRVGDAVLEYTGLCHPCSKMERTFGAGGYNAMRGHGGITARIVSGGTIRLGDAVVALNALPEPNNA
jgi:MOSC domain-containing protein YiiM